MRGFALPSGATEQASAMLSDWVAFLAVAAVVFAVVLGLIAFPLVRWRRREPGDAASTTPEPPQFRNNYALEIAWTAVPLAMVAGLFAYTYRAEARVDAIDAHPAVVVAVAAYRWGWSFAYDGGPTVGGSASAPAGPSRTTAVQPELVIPAGETTRIDLSARDVDHGFWVPAFFFKRDAIPGQTTSFDLTPTSVGTFQGRCSAFCGLDHAEMLFRVRVMTPAAFAAWRRAPATVRT